MPEKKKKKTRFSFKNVRMTLGWNLNESAPKLLNIETDLIVLIFKR